ncbi:MAG: DUF6519 domain-containing protein [Gemmatimonadales bacterium]
MHGDFSRLTFDPRNHFSRVLVQQGRVYLDAEPNEQAAILLHAMRAFTRDVIGPHGIPANAEPMEQGFRISPPGLNEPGFEIGIGRYYVDGILCENDESDAKYFDQPDYFQDPVANPLPAGPYLVFLDVWERHLTFVDRPLLRETALGGPDTASRAQVVWQVKVVEPPSAGFADPPTPAEIGAAVQERTDDQRPRMRSRVKPGDVSTTPCVMPPGGGYRGRENQLYRVEVHQSGAAGTATFKWSRDNGSITFPVSAVTAGGVKVEQLGLDATRTLVPGDWVELLDDLAVLHGRPGILARVESIESRTVALAAAGNASLTGAVAVERRPFLRRWDHRGAPPASGTVTITESADGNTGWLDLEDGIQVHFDALAAGARYVTGDYWTIAARTSTGGIEWPEIGGVAAALPAQGIEHHYAPLARMTGAVVNKRFRRILTTTMTTEA